MVDAEMVPRYVQSTFSTYKRRFSRTFATGQDVFLLSSPSPYSRRLALTFLSLLNTPFEHVSLHRDIGEAELKQSREIRQGGELVYVDSPVVRAAKEGKTLILEGIERCERGILPILNNLLENREMVSSALSPFPLRIV